MNNIASLEPKILSRHAISAEQLGIWYIQRLEPTCSAYNMVVAFDVKVNQPLAASRWRFWKQCYMIIRYYV